MIAIEGVPVAIVVMLCGMFFLGTAPALWNKVERGGRIPSHTMLDYIVAYVIVGVTTTLTLGQLGPPPPNGAPNFLQQVQQANGPLVGFSIASGIFLGIGDVALQYAVAFLGMAIGPPIMNALTVILGIIISYFLDGGINKAYLVFPGMALAAAAIGLGVMAHLTSSAVQERRNEKSVRGHDLSGKGASFTVEQAAKSASQAGYALAIVCVSTVPEQGSLSSPISATAAGPAAVAATNAKNPASVLMTQRSCPGLPVLSRQPTGAFSRQPTGTLRSVQKADTSIYLGLAIAVAGEGLSLALLKRQHKFAACSHSMPA